MSKTILSTEPQLDDGCSCRSWRCESPNRDDMEKGRVDGTEPTQVRKECKRCPVCRMIYCKYHMSEANHMKDCNFRSNQERELLQTQRAESTLKEQQRQREESIKAKKQAIFEVKEKKRRQAILDRNEKHKGK